MAQVVAAYIESKIMTKHDLQFVSKSYCNANFKQKSILNDPMWQVSEFHHDHVLEKSTEPHDIDNLLHNYDTYSM